MRRAENMFNKLFFAILSIFIINIIYNNQIVFADLKLKYDEVIEKDLNNDGKIDGWLYKLKGESISMEVDSDYDGKLDDVSFFKNGAPHISYYDKNGDSNIDEITLYIQSVKGGYRKTILLEKVKYKGLLIFKSNEMPWGKCDSQKQQNLNSKK